MAKRGRPTKLTPELILAVCTHIEQGNFRLSASRVCGVDVATLRHWMYQGKKQPGTIYGELRAALIAAEAKAEVEAVRLIRGMEAKDAKCLIWWLERKFPTRWGRDRSLILELERRLAELEKQRPPAQAATSRAGSGEGASDG